MARSGLFDGVRPTSAIGVKQTFFPIGSTQCLFMSTRPSSRMRVLYKSKPALVMSHSVQVPAWEAYSRPILFFSSAVVLNCLKQFARFIHRSLQVLLIPNLHG
jgi:hypothetical protein